MRKARAPQSDHDLGIHTTRVVPVEDLRTEGSNLIHAHRYEPTPYGVLSEMLEGLGIDYSAYRFVDLGSGKGRVICLAAHYPFAEVVGVELCRKLHEIACENVAELPQAWRRCRKVLPVHGDAAAFRFSPQPTVVFLFNPFGAPVLARVVKNLEAAQGIGSERTYVLYHAPVHEAVLARAPFLERHVAEKNWVIYASVSPAR